MQRIKSILCLCLLFTGCGNTYAIDDYGKTIRAFKETAEAVSFFDEAYGYAVFPTIGKGGLGIGFARGLGQVYQAGEVRGTASMTQVSVGAQVGGQAFSQIVFFQSKFSYDQFTQGEFEFGAQATAVAITASAQARSGSTTGNSASANQTQSKTKYQNGMAVFVLAKGGLMYEASVSGQKYKFNPL